MSELVLDCSVTMAWCFEDEASPQADAALARLTDTPAVVPSLWSLEVTNVLVLAERRSRLTPANTARFLALLRALPITVEDPPIDRVFAEVLHLARSLQLTAYDAAYLELAMRRGGVLCTLDNVLENAARAVGVPLFAG